MRTRLTSIFTATALLVMSISCATLELTPAATSMPAARAGLRPEFRFFYDALRDDGDWVLIEPYGWVFRPRVNWVAWRPYRSGFWVPSDLYGWTWVSTEQFGWATYHYGQWLYDRFEGWVWFPGLDWGPAWVAWERSDGYVGWAPQSPAGVVPEGVPGGAYLYVPTNQLPATDLVSHASVAADVGRALGNLEPADQIVVRDGVSFNRGPRFEDIERSIGQPLTRVELDKRTPGMGGTARRGAASGAAWTAADSADAVRRAGADAAREARVVAVSKLPAPARVQVVQAPPRGGAVIDAAGAGRTEPARGAPAATIAEPARRVPGGKRAEPDSTR